MEQLQKYIKESRESGKSDIDIRNELLQNGWDENTVNNVLPTQDISQQQPQNFNQEIPQKKKSKLGLILLIIFLLLLLIGLPIWYYFYKTIDEIILVGEPVIIDNQEDSIDFFIPISPITPSGDLFQLSSNGYFLVNWEIASINAEDNIIFEHEEKVRYKDLEFISPPKQGTDMILLFDNSGSMGLGNEEQTKELIDKGYEPNDPDRISIKSGLELIDLIRNNDRVKIITFGTSEDNVNVSRLFGYSTRHLDNAVKVTQDFTNDRDKLKEEVENIDVYSGWFGTPLFNSINIALDKIEERSDDSRLPIIFVLADGDDNWRGVGTFRSSVVSKAQDMNVPIFSVIFGQEYDPDDLRYISRETGGVFAHSRDAQELGSLFEGMGSGIFSGRVNLHQRTKFEESLKEDTYVIRGNITSTNFGRVVNIPFNFEFVID